MEMTRQEYIRDKHTKLIKKGFELTLLSAIFLFYFCSVMDWYYAREHVVRFVLYRTAVVIIFIVIYFTNKQWLHYRYQNLLVVAATTTASIGIQAMIMAIGGHTTAYYAGHNLVIISGLSFIPVAWGTASLIVLSVYAIYVIPIVLFTSLTDPAIFVVHNVFMICTALIAFVGRLSANRSLTNELGLEYDLLQERKNLEVQVQDRTIALRKSESWHRELFNSAMDAILVVNKDHVIINANAQTFSLFQSDASALIGEKVDSLLKDWCSQLSCNDLFTSKKESIIESECRQKTGQVVFLEIGAKRIELEEDVYIRIVLRDITERKRYQERLYETQKLDSIGLLAGGVAHDFRNVITSVQGFIDIVRSGRASEDKLAKYTATLEHGIQNAALMISQLLDFARTNEHAIYVTNLNNIVHASAKLFELVLGKQIVLSMDLDYDITNIEGDPVQLENVVMNLLSNARDSMKDGNGFVTIKTYMKTVRPISDDVVDNALAAGEYVVLQVSDTGCGMTQEIQNKLFEPFFSTKPRGKGTGLGLAMVYGVVKKHRGNIEVMSMPGKGSIFSLYFPATDKTVTPIFDSHETPEMGNNETVMVVDDTEAVLEFMTEHLTRHGYKVLQHNSAVDAVAAYRANHDEVSLVLTDVVMPLMSGVELAKNIRKINPGVNILMMSAYPQLIEGGDQIEDCSFLKKPFTEVQLITAVNKALQTNTSSADIAK